MKAPHNEYECARAWSALATAHALVTERISEALMRACGLSINDFEVLLRLDQVPPMRLNDIRGSIRLSQPAVSRMIARLEDKGLLDRVADPSDGRGVLISITGPGRKALRKAVPVHAQVIREHLLDKLTRDENDQLSAILDRIVAGQNTRPADVC